MIVIDEGEPEVSWKPRERFDEVSDALVGVGGPAHAQDFVRVPFGSGCGPKEIRVDTVGDHPDPLDRDAKVPSDLTSAHR